MRTDRGWIGQVVLVALVFLAGCSAPSSRLSWTDADIAPDIIASRTVIHVEGEELRAVVMLPESAQVLASRSMPGVVILAGGSDVLGGARWDAMALADAAALAREGVAVMALDTPGAITPEMGFDDLVNAMRRHIGTEGGASLMPSMLTTLCAEVSAVDPARLYVAGIGASAAAALKASTFDDRVRGVIVYQPSLARPIGESTLELIEAQVSGARAYLREAEAQGAAGPVLRLESAQAESILSETRMQVAQWISKPK